MKKIISTILIISNFIFTNQLLDQYGESNNSYFSFIDRINTNHYFSMLSSSSEGSLNTYGIYGNSTHFTLNNRTQLYSNFNINWFRVFHMKCKECFIMKWIWKIVNVKNSIKVLINIYTYSF